ncbi:hypothetical protein BX661DRAFT_45823 [Kickxella alabastrina]|uniref:uncharacterized protein n=1 Tax=Kickxella alabastrina TaxID=61397 RepID=UPI00221ECB2B|nr:uncharacterized protein BX661DRAFT_45823 [Kickxella alabastrina]KAI7824188.1 hypothetical protein BX661DRAFT_45823 [Kickxella alabastrina]
MDLPASLQSQAELRQLNEGVLQLLPDMQDVSGRALLMDHLVHQLDSSNPSKLNAILNMANPHSGSSADPMLSAASGSNSIYSGQSPQPVSGGVAASFDLTSSPEDMHRMGMTSMPLNSYIMYSHNYPGNSIPSYPPLVSMHNPTLTELASMPANNNSAPMPMPMSNPSVRVSSTPHRIPSLSPSMGRIPDPAVSLRPIARSRGMTSGPVPMVPPLSLYSNIYTPMQLQQAQQAQYDQMQQNMANQQYAQSVMSGHRPGAPSLPPLHAGSYSKNKLPLPNAQIDDPEVHKAQMNALMAYRAMGLQCKAPDSQDDEDDGSQELSLDEWLDAEKLTETEVLGNTNMLTPAATPSTTQVDEPELEDADLSSEAYYMSHPSVKNSLLVQRSSGQMQTRTIKSEDEPVSYMRQRQALAASKAAESASESIDDSDGGTTGESADEEVEEIGREELVNVAMQLLARINILYLRKVEEEKQQQQLQSSEHDDIDDLERELDAMNIGGSGSAAPVIKAVEDNGQQDIINRMAKLGLSTSTNSVCV